MKSETDAQSVSFEAFARFERVEPEQNVARFYIIEHRRTLWGEPAVVTTWGRVGGQGRSLATVCESQAEADAVAARASARRLDRGYELRERRCSLADVGWPLGERLARLGDFCYPDLGVKPPPGLPDAQGSSKSRES